MFQLINYVFRGSFTCCPKESYTKQFLPRQYDRILVIENKMMLYKSSPLKSSSEKSPSIGSSIRMGSHGGEIKLIDDTS